MMRTEMNFPFFSLSLPFEGVSLHTLAYRSLNVAEMRASTDRVSAFYCIFLKAFVVLSEMFKNIGSAALYILIF